MDILKAGKRRFSAGLLWQPPTESRFLGRKILASMAADLDGGYDAAAVRRAGKGLQAGFGVAGDDWRAISKAPALVSLLETEPNFLGVFALANASGNPVYWVHLRINGVVSETGDKIHATREEALASAAFLKSVTGVEPEVHEDPDEAQEWISVHIRYNAIDEWILARGQVVMLDRLLSRSMVRSFAMAGVFFAIIMGVSFALDHHRESLMMAKAKMEAQARKLKKQEMELHPERFFTPDWEKRPGAVAFFRACVPDMLAVPLSENGWRMNIASCDGKVLAIDWRHEMGADFTLLPEGAFLDEEDVRTARGRTRLENPAETPEKVSKDGSGYKDLLTRQELLGLLAEITQATGTKLSPPRFTTPESKTIDKMKILAPWHEASWELSDIPDALFLDGDNGISLFSMLAEIPGLSMDSITWQDGWKIKGRAYARK